MRTEESIAGAIAGRLVKANSVFFDWLIEPLAKILEPHVENKYVRNVPNAISVGRNIAAVIVSVSIYQATSNFWHWFFVVGIVACIMSDGIDGALARRLKIQSSFGAMIDPLADKVLIAGLAIGLSFRFDTYLFGVPVLALLLIELSNGLIGYRGNQLAKQLHQPEKSGSSIWGKVKFGVESAAALLGWAFVPYFRDATLLGSTTLFLIAIPLAALSLRGYLIGVTKAEAMLRSR